MTLDNYLTLRSYFRTTFDNFKRVNLLTPGNRIVHELDMIDDMITDVINFTTYTHKEDKDKYEQIQIEGPADSNIIGDPTRTAGYNEQQASEGRESFPGGESDVEETN